MEFLSEEPSINLFIIGDLEVFGYDTDFQDIWAQFNEQGEIKAVLLRFYQSFIPYAKGEFDVAQFVSIINSFPQPHFLSGKSEIVEKFEAYKELQSVKNNKPFLLNVRVRNTLKIPNGYYIRLTLDDIDQILSLRKSIDEFQIRDDAREMLLTSMQSNTARSYFTEESGKMTACVSTTAENSISAMIVGVCTRKNFAVKDWQQPLCKSFLKMYQMKARSFAYFTIIQKLVVSIND